MSLDANKLLWMYKTMVTIRGFEEKAFDLFKRGLVRGSIHFYIGEEAMATGACGAIQPGDAITATHRGHGQCIAKGANVNLMLAELLGKATGYCKGKGGSMHIADVDAGILGANGIVGGGIPLATGAALAFRLQKAPKVVLCFFGDGASNQGGLLESANLASIWKLPVVYICENNHYGMSMCVLDSVACPNIADRAVAFGMPGVVVDGNDVLAVHEAVTAAVARARDGEGPTFIEGKTYRWMGHYSGDAELYRTKEEKEGWMKKDPIARFEKILFERKILDDAKAQALRQEAEKQLEAAEKFAIESPEPALDTLLTDIYA
jgi:acetoin:2,6-dichlorophenolindophenol oxidoreductase subunit alpha